MLTIYDCFRKCYITIESNRVVVENETARNGEPYADGAIWLSRRTD